MKLNMKTVYSTISNRLAWSSKISALLVAIMLMTVVVAGCATGSGVQSIPPAPVGSNPPVSGTTVVSSLYDENTVVSLYERSIPAVVEIVTVLEAGSSVADPSQGVPSERGQGSGFFIDGEGHILTNYHVVEKAKTVNIALHNNSRVEAKIVGTDPQNDLALLQVNTSDAGRITFLPLGNSDNIKPGQMAIAMGSPYGLEGSVTVGVISGVGRSLPGTTSRPIVNMIQTDAAINPGNSGGPLFNSKGEVIGINTAIEASARRIGFAIPINNAKLRLPLLLKGGEVKSPWLGIEGRAIDQEFASRLGLSVKSGIYIVSIFSGSPAEKAGLKEGGRNTQREPNAGGDIVTAVDSVPLTKVEDLLSYFNSKKPGDKVSLAIYRGNQQMTVSVELGEWGKTPLSPANKP